MVKPHLGGALEHYAVAKTHSATAQLMELAPKMARVKRDGTEMEAPIEQVQVGDIVLVRPGEQIPVDGTVVAGHAAVNQSPLTGDSLPVEKSVGDEVFAGTFNESGWLEIRATQVGNATKLGQIIRLVEEAQARKGKVQRLADRYAQWFVPILLGIGGLTFVVFRFGLGLEAQQTWLRVVSVLVVACPCAMILVTPTAVVAALGRLARSGILVKGGIYLEQLAEVDCFAFDKTGTLTEGKLRVLAVVPFGDCPPEELLALAASAEQSSSHLIARAIVEEAERRHLPLLPLGNSENFPGMGVKATVQKSDGTTAPLLVGSKSFLAEHLPETPAHFSLPADLPPSTLVFVAREGEVLGAIALSDSLRAEAAEVLTELRALGISHLALLTGDNAAVAASIAHQLPLDEVHSELLPQEKVAWVQDCQRQGHKVAMVGDGINDAPVLTAADVGIALGSIGTDIALEAADVVLMTDDLSRLPETVQVSRQMLRIIRQNLFGFALGVNAVGVGLAASGVLSPIGAAIMHQFASLLVVLNSLRLLLDTRPLAAKVQRTVQNFRLLRTWLTDAWANLQEWAQRHPHRAASLLAGILVALWMLSGFYIVKPDEVALVQRLGKLVAEDVPSGLHYRLPFPFTRVTKVRKGEIRRVEIGFRTLPPSQRQQEPFAYEWNFPHQFGRYRKIAEEAIMVTGDENLVSVNAVVHYRIADTSDFLFRLSDPDNFVRMMGESILREWVAQFPLDAVLVAERPLLEGIVRQCLQERLMRSRTGIEVVAVRLQDVHPPIEVVDAFRKVASALEEKEASINQAEAYRNAQIPMARGKAGAQLKAADAYKWRRIWHAAGEAYRWQWLAEVYRQFPEVTRIRLYLEAIEQALAGKPKVIMDARQVGRKQILFVDEKGLALSLPEAVSSLPKIPSAPPEH